jgi:D-alanyl-D-alanine carboxypeptidase
MTLLIKTPFIKTFVNKTLFNKTMAAMLFPLLWLSFSPRAAATDNSSALMQIPVNQIDEVISKASRPFSGVILISQDGRPLYRHIAGQGISEQSRFVLGSLSKQVAATLILRAVDEGKLVLSHPANDYLPQDERIDARITVHQLLSHTSGIAPESRELQFTPGSQFAYSNFGYELLGRILENVNHRSLAKQLTEFAAQQQLDMTASHGLVTDFSQSEPMLMPGFAEQDGKREPMAKLDQKLRFPEPLLAAGSLQASAGSFARFQTLLHGGKLLSKDSYLAMTSKQASRQHRWGELDYGYGVQLSDADQLREISHSGYIRGFIGTAVYYPGSNLSLVVLENTSWDLNDTGRVFGIHDQIRQLLRRSQLNPDAG